VTLLSLVAATCSLAAGADADGNQRDTGFSPSRILEITDVVLENHIDPPTRQQMILSGIKALYLANNLPVPGDLSARVSRLASPDEIAEYLSRVRAQFDEQQDAEAIETILTNGMFDALPGHAALIKSEDDRVQEQVRANRYVGIGITLDMNEDEEWPRIPKVFYNGPAWKAGVLAGDVLLEVNAETTASQEMHHIVERLRGEEGTEVTIVVRAPDSQESRRLTMTRGRVFIPTVEGFREKLEGQWQYSIDAANDLALIRIKAVGPSTLHELRQAEVQLRGEAARGIILDLREGGGTLHDLVMVADELLDGGVIGHVRSLDSVETYEARPGALFQGLPMVVLIGRFSQADRIFLTAALQDQGRAIVVGEVTAGESYVNSFVPIPGRDDRLRMATAVMQRGDGTLLAAPRAGMPIAPARKTASAPEKKPGCIIPEHVVAGIDGVQLEADQQLAKAIEVLRKLAAAVPPPART
jgi:carboxyl-terminal processing protease